MKFVYILFLAAIFATSSLAQTWYTNPANGHQYAELTPTQGWVPSEAEAVSLGGHLVSINNAAENQWILDTFLDFHGAPNWMEWIGLTEVLPYDPNNRQWQWISGDPVTYTNWDQGEPSSPAEHYVMFDQNGRWHDLADGSFPPPFNYQAAIVEVTPEPSTLVTFGCLLFYVLRRQR